MTRELRRTFDEDPERYHRARPGYPAQLFDDLAAAHTRGARKPENARLLEIGCGTGLATAPLAVRGYQITAVELGPGMAAVARRNLAGHTDVEVVTAAFEQWPLPPEPFDVVFAATAFHWIDPASRITKSADALRLGGVLATVATHHIAGGTTGFFAEAQRCYERFDPATPPGLRLEAADEIPVDDREILESDRFGTPVFHRYEWEATYTTAEYLDLLLTYSGHRALPEPRRASLLACLGALIDGHGGRIVKRYLSELRTATRIR